MVRLNCQRPEYTKAYGRWAPSERNVHTFLKWCWKAPFNTEVRSFIPIFLHKKAITSIKRGSQKKACVCCGAETSFPHLYFGCFAPGVKSEVCKAASSWLGCSQEHLSKWWELPAWPSKSRIARLWNVILWLVRRAIFYAAAVQLPQLHLRLCQALEPALPLHQSCQFTVRCYTF